MENIKEVLYGYFSGRLKNILKNTDETVFAGAEEIRLRVEKPLYIKSGKNEYFLNGNGVCSVEKSYVVSIEDILQSLELISGFSAYAFREEISCGYITVARGIRIGIAGQAVFENGSVKNIKNISSLNFRIPREVKGCSEKVIDFIRKEEVKNTLIISPPGAGKTTLLRDIIRSVSDGDENKKNGMSVGVVDERCEISGAYLGVSQNDVGIRTDVLERCPKHIGMSMLLRAMSPNVIAVDEIGCAEDINAILDIINSGVKFICTAHGKSVDDIKKREEFEKIIKKGVFEVYIVLSNQSGAGTIQNIFDENFEKLF